MRTDGMIFLVAALALPTTSIDSNSGHALVYSTVHKAVLMIHGQGFATHGRIWRWTGKAWHLLDETGPPPRTMAAMAFDTDRGVLVIQGGSVQLSGGSNATYAFSDETWEWNGKKWRLAAKGGPGARDHHSMAYDSVRRRMVLFGGGQADASGRSEFYGDTWEWDGKTWRRIATEGPRPRVHHSLVFDAERRQVLMVGGYNQRGADGITWAWDGRSWKSVAQGEPALRSSPRLAFDSARRRVVLFGGRRQMTPLGDTYIWNGSAWQLSTATGPTPRSVHGLAYDPVRKTMVLFGGHSAGVDLGDTWEFDGSKWIRR